MSTSFPLYDISDRPVIQPRFRQGQSERSIAGRFALRSIFCRRNFLKIGMILAAIAVILLLMMSFLKPTQAEEDTDAVKQYKSIVIHSGDTLWSIASEYMDGHYSDHQEYIQEVMFINNLNSDLIYANEYLLVPYYVS